MQAIELPYRYRVIVMLTLLLSNNKDAYKILLYPYINICLQLALRSHS
jgi:hypothetical protein